MNRYQLENANHKIDGYWVPLHHRTESEHNLRREFEAAKASAIQQLSLDLADVQAVTFEQFCKFKRLAV
jgi:hypothetical protein